MENIGNEDLMHFWWKQFPFCFDIEKAGLIKFDLWRWTLKHVISNQRVVWIYKARMFLLVDLQTLLL